MGGSAFAKKLSTPRMPPSVYVKVRDETLTTLRKFYRYAESPIEAPGKTDHGDVDILVAEPLPGTKPEAIAKILGAKEVIMVKGSPTTNMALPWPVEMLDKTEEFKVSANLGLPVDTLEIAETRPKVSPLGTAKSDKFIQLDLHICESYQNMQWGMFHQAHGDLWLIVNGIIKRFGLTVSNTSLYIRIEELDSYNKELGRVILTEDPKVVLEFLELDVKRFWVPFGSLNEMMAYAATCRFHDPARGADKDKSRAEHKSNNRPRALKRQAFAIWIDDYLPAHRDDPAGKAAGMTREEVVQQAKRYFGKEFADCFEQKKADGIRAWGIEKLWANLRKELPVQGIEMGYVMKGLKREVIGGNEEQLWLKEVQQAYKDGDFGFVTSWAQEHWKEAGERQKALDKEKSHRVLMEKLECDRNKMDSEERKAGAGI